MNNEDSISLNKYISERGICSRREADTLIEAGRVKLNGEIAKRGNRVFEGDEVLVDGKRIGGKEKAVYILLNKPRGIVTTTDKREPKNIIDFINYPKRLFHVGRLDKQSEGLIMLTNDGDIVNKILRANYEHEKEYVVTVDRAVDRAFAQKMSNGIPILDTVTKRCRVSIMGEKQFSIILTQGLNRQIRRMCEYLGYEVKKLKRIRIMHITLGGLKSGEWRVMSKKEVTRLMREVEK